MLRKMFGTGVTTTSLNKQHLYWVNEEGKVVDLGKAGLEDLKLTAYVTEQARSRLSVRKNTASQATLTRVESLCKRMYDKARLTK